MVEWLTAHNVEHDPKSNLFDIIRQMQPDKKCKTDVAAGEVEMDVLRLPVGHCELNPIELVWANVKHYAAANNRDFTMVEIERLSKEGIHQVTKLGQMCQTENDHLVEEAVERLVIEPNAEDSDSSSDDSDTSVN